MSTLQVPINVILSGLTAAVTGASEVTSPAGCHTAMGEMGFTRVHRRNPLGLRVRILWLEPCMASVRLVVLACEACVASHVKLEGLSNHTG